MLLLWPVLLSAQVTGNQLAQLTYCYSATLRISPPWEININFDTTRIENGWVAATQASVDYHSAIISFDTLLIQRLAPPQVRRVVVHELWHVVLWELGLLAEETDHVYATRVQEQLVEHASRVLAPKVCR